MPTAAELLKNISTQPDPEGHIIVGGDRIITIPDNLKRLGVQFDHNMETVTFDCPRYWDNRDMSKMAVYVNYMLSNGYRDRYPADSVRADGDVMHFDWTISRNVTQVPGVVSFLICVMETDEEGNEERHWNSELSQEAYISPGMETDESPVDIYPDIVTQLLLRMDSVEQINVKADEMQELYESTVEVANTVEEIKNQALDASGYIKNSYANAIKQNVSGEIIRVNDVSPIEHDVKCRVRGKNLFDISKIFTTTASTSIAYISEIGTDYIMVTTDAGYTGNGFCTVPVKLKDVCPGLEVGKTYVLTAKTESNSSNIYFPGILKSWVFGTTMIMTEELLNSALTFYGFSTLHNMGTGSCKISNIQIEPGDVATEYKPYIDPTTVTVTGCGKNVLELSGNITHNGVTKTVDTNGLITVIGTSTSSININVGFGFMKAGCKYRPLIQKVKSDVAPSFWNFQTQANINKDKNGYISSEVDTEFSAFIYTASAGTVYDSAFKVMVELVTDNMTDEYESYKGTDVAVTSSDGTCTLTSKSPIMTLYTDTPGAIIEAEYNANTKTYLENCFRPTDEQVQASVDAWLTNHYTAAEGVSF